MKKEFIGLAVIFVVSFGSFLSIRNNVPSIEPTQDNILYDEYLEDIGVDTFYLPSTKAYIFDDELLYIKSYNDEAYITPNSQFITYYRHWGIEGIVNQEFETDIEHDVLLFSEGNNYVSIVSFTLPYVYNTADIDLGSLGFGYSNDYDLTVLYSISYLDNLGHEYRLQHQFLQFDELNMVPIEQLRTQATGEVTEVYYTYYVKAVPSIDNDLDGDLFYSMSIDIYNTIPESEKTIVIGFNKISEGSNELYSVKRKRVIYERGNL